MDIHLAQQFETYLDNYTKSFVGGTISNVITQVTRVVGIALTISLMYSSLRPANDEAVSLNNLLSKAIRWGVICSTATVGGLYQVYIVDIILKSPDMLASLFITQGSLTTTSTLIDEIASTGFTTAITALGQSGVLSVEGLTMLIEGFFIGAVTVFMVLIGIVVTLVSKFFLAILVCLGPLAIFCLLFASTTPIFGKWLAACIGSALTTLMFGLAFTFVAHFFTAAFSEVDVKGGGSAGLFGALGMSTIVTGLAYVFVRQIPSIAASLGDGIHVASPGIVSAAKSAFGAHQQVQTSRALSKMASEGNSMTSQGDSGGVPASLAHGSTSNRR